MLVWERMESAEGVRTKRVVENVGSGESWTGEVAS